MTSSGFAKAMPHVLAYEGGKVDDPHDPGGRTNQGVIQRVYSAWRIANGQADRDVYKMVNTERDAIYRKQYWDAIRGDELPAGADFAVFDGAVNSGPKQSIKWLQRAVGVQADGVLGAVTLAKVLSYSDQSDLVDAICDRRMAFLRALKTFKRFGKGWTTRVEKVRATAKAMLAGPVPVTKLVARVENAKADILDAEAAPGSGLGVGTSTAGAVTSGLGGAVNQLQENLTPFSQAGNVWIDNLVVILIVAGALLLVGGLAYRWYTGKRKVELADALDTQPEMKVV